MRILFMGTPDFAVPSLKAIDSKHKVIGVVTQIDRPRGRGQRLQPSPVKAYALEKDIAIYQPVKLSKEVQFIKKFQELKPDLIVTCAFGQILPQSILDIPKYGTINVHASLLPKYRGAAPIQWSIINGDEKTGITTMFTELGLDTGDMLLQSEINITKDMTAGELHDRLSLLGAETLLETIKAIEDGNLIRIKQDDNLATYACKIDKTTGLIDWSKPSSDIHNLIRGTTPWPGAYTEICGKRTRICCSSLDDTPSDLDDKINDKNILPGTVLELNGCDMWVKTLDGTLLVKEIQVESCKRMTPHQYACGHHLESGMILG